MTGLTNHPATVQRDLAERLHAPTKVPFALEVAVFAAGVGVAASRVRPEG